MKALDYHWFQETDGFWYGRIVDTWNCTITETTAGYPTEAGARAAVELEYRRQTKIVFP